ncbi:FMN reductase/FAD reductase [NAD(P)H] [Alteribacillus persepolensis]|uniref:FMN reductase/FAD reductase [NAD(P)H] n=1 Tax=Alteribacillus persepolensis TaxID=568899 RepID=A0A1G8HRE8_9BACI|nr:NAD(P)H-dependent oxidoreductase [Alteribacillus persepolensis]SDI09051.1 FMN reductase/FAD reductase [NAD(P)H] [Alteribacillus persepolensis]
MKIIGLSGTIIGSKTSVAIQHILEEVKKADTSVETECIDLREYSIEFCDGREAHHYNADTRKVIEKMSYADVYIIGTPIFNASMSGALKNTLDLIPPSVFHKKVMGFVATGGSSEHYFVIENQLKTIAGYYQAYVTTNNMLIHRNSFGDNNKIIDKKTAEKMTALADELVLMGKNLTKITSP